MNKAFVLLIISSSLISASIAVTPWGFFAHKAINRLAVFTLPSEMMPVYKKNIEHLTSKATAPDMRRFSSENEAIRHYIDIDHWGDTPFDDVPRFWSDAILKFADFYIVEGDDSTLIRSVNHDLLPQKLEFQSAESVDVEGLGILFSEMPPWLLYERSWTYPKDSVSDFIIGSEEYSEIRIVDRFSSFGIAPYNLVQAHNRLAKAFEDHDLQKILFLSADIGHYMADVHVPLHTTENYNGGMTDQLGIHAFWESRLPELFADKEYDFFVGKANYIKDIRTYVWELVEDSHSKVQDVLDIEKRLSHSFPSDLQFCYEERFDKTVRTQCQEYSRAYHEEMDGMVEEQMKKAVKAVGEIWLSAWALAGQPDMREIANEYKMTKEELAKEQELQKKIREGNILGRDHNN